MTNFRTHFRESGFVTLLETFGEPVVYHLQGGGTRSITAIVNRSPPAIFDAGGEVVLPELTVRIHNHCKLGMLASEVDTGGDTIELQKEVGDAENTTLTVMTKLREDSGVVELACR